MLMKLASYKCHSRLDPLGPMKKRALGCYPIMWGVFLKTTLRIPIRQAGFNGKLQFFAFCASLEVNSTTENLRFFEHVSKFNTRPANSTARSWKFGFHPRKEAGSISNPSIFHGGGEATKSFTSWMIRIYPSNTGSIEMPSDHHKMEL